MVKSLEYLRVKDLNFHYVKEKKIINHINLTLYKDQITVIKGENGSGKTTLGKLLMGILEPIEGKVFICDRDISDMTLGQIGNKVGYLFQNPEKQFFAHTVEDEIAFIMRSKGLDEEYIQSRVEELLGVFDLTHLRDSFPLKLSQGEKKRLAIAGILVNDIEYLILDEPTSGLDVRKKESLTRVLSELHKRGMGMTIISHDDDFIADLAHRVIKIHRGEIVEDKTKGN